MEQLEEKVVMDVRDQIAAHLESKGIKKSWLAKKIDITPAHLGFILSKDRTLTEENRVAINEALETSF